MNKEELGNIIAASSKRYDLAWASTGDKVILPAEDDRPQIELHVLHNGPTMENAHEIIFKHEEKIYAIYPEVDSEDSVILEEWTFNGMKEVEPVERTYTVYKAK